MKLKRLFAMTITTLILVLSLISHMGQVQQVNAQQPKNTELPNIVWQPVTNISQSPDKTSNDPFVLGDPSGKVHLFWAEKFSDDPTNQPDTLVYSTWNGSVWSEPLDIFTTLAENPLIAAPRALMDDQGQIHLFWMDQPKFPSQTLYYSSVQSSQATNSQAWSKQVDLANDLSGTKFSFHMAYTPPNTLHVIYAKIRQGDNPGDLRGVAYMRSDDLGKSWSEPVDIFKVDEFQNGASDTRLLTVEPDKVFATWTEWDTSGNGQRIYFARSLDNGKTWEEPIILTQKAPNDYERDWNNLYYLGDQTIVSVWEGGYRAYRQFMYSHDWGETWSEPIDTFSWLIGETGTAEFATDSLGRLYLFYANRVREGNANKTDASGLWYSIWLGDENWSEPELIASVPCLNPRVAIMNGNQIVATWTSTVHNEIMIAIGKIQDAPGIEPVTYEKPLLIPVETNTPEPTPSPEPTKSIEVVTSFTTGEGNTNATEIPSVGIPILLGSTIAICFIIGLYVIVLRRHR